MQPSPGPGFGCVRVARVTVEERKDGLGYDDSVWSLWRVRPAQCFVGVLAGSFGLTAEVLRGSEKGERGNAEPVEFGSRHLHSLRRVDERALDIAVEQRAVR